VALFARRPVTPVTRRPHLVSALAQLAVAGAIFAMSRMGRGDRTDAHPRPDARHGFVAGDGRGRDADSPMQIPARGWKDVLVRVYHAMSEDRLLLVAAGITFYALLALFPAIAALVSIYGLVSDPADISRQLEQARGFLPSGAIDIIGEQVRRLTEHGGGALGFAFVSGLVVSLWSANAGVKSLFDGLNVVYAEQEKRSFLRLNAQSLAFTLGLIVFAALALAGIVVVPVVLNLIDLGTSAQTLISLARWPVLLVVVILALAVLYRHGPSRDTPKWRWVTWGGAAAAVAWIAGSMLFSWYVSNFGSYDKTYGSLGAAIGLMTWLWLSIAIVLLGAEINAQSEHQTARDPTEGPRQPMGTLGAKMADTVGARSG